MGEDSTEQNPDEEEGRASEGAKARSEEGLKAEERNRERRRGGRRGVQIGGEEKVGDTRHLLDVGILGKTILCHLIDLGGEGRERGR